MADRKAGRSWINRMRTVALVAVPVLLGVFWIPDLVGTSSGVVFRMRNYYGIYEVDDTKDVRLLHHGTTMHGAQLRIPGLELQPSAYYSATSPAGELLLSDEFHFRSFGVVGLGAGTLAVYTLPGQTMDFFELDPDIHAIAKRYFTFLENAPGKVEVIYGDARRSLDLSPDRKYDVFVVDAFGGDAIPVHLVTREAIAKYRQHLNEQGLLLFHITNRFTHVERVLGEVAEDAGARAHYRTTSGAPAGLPSHWMALTWDAERSASLVARHGWRLVATGSANRPRLWTDGYSSVLPFLDWAEMKSSLLGLKPFAQEPGR